MADDHAVDRVELVVDGSVVVTAQDWWDQGLTWKPGAGLAGPVRVTIRAYDYANRMAEAETRVALLDTVAPRGSFVAPAGTHVTPFTDVAVSSPDKDLATVTVNGVQLLQISGTGLWKGRVAPIDGNLTAVLTDVAGNQTSIGRRAVVDSYGPVVTTVTPGYHARLRGTFVSTLSGVTDAAGVAKAELWANGKYVGRDVTAPYSLAVQTGTQSGYLNLSWRLTDKLGNTRTHNRQVIADNKAPAVSTTKAPKNKAKVTGTVSVKASDASGIARVELIVNGTVVARDTTAGYLLSVNTRKQKKTMKVRVRAYDKAGNVTYAGTRTWYRK